ncbi:MAG: DUF1385 domain-containing protein [bacterium]
MVNSKPKAGGQAVIEGVMMLVPGGYAMSVRQPDKQIKTEKKPFKKITEKNKILKLIFIRGIASFAESMILGYESINKSAEIAFGETSSGTFKETFYNILIIVLSLALGFGIFFFIPIYVGSLLKLQSNQIVYNLFIGAFRFLLFIIYIVSISFIKDIKRIFMYHGAEHKTIYAYENEEELTVENIKKYSTKHPRCGTSFIFITLFSAIVFYSVIDYFVFMTLGIPNSPLNRFINHMIFLPIVASVSYELLMLAGKYYKNPIVRVLVYPGILFQYITTKEPTDDMIEVAVESLKSAFEAAGETEKK